MSINLTHVAYGSAANLVRYTFSPNINKIGSTFDLVVIVIRKGANFFE